MQKVVLLASLALCQGLKFEAVEAKPASCKGKKTDTDVSCTAVKDEDCGKSWIVAGAYNVQCGMTEHHCASVGPFCREVFGPDFEFAEGLVAWFKSENAAAPDWPNEVEGADPAKTAAGTVTVKTESGHGAKSEVKFIAGGTGEQVNFGEILDTDYTVCSIDRYTGGSKGRILQANGRNWLHGHWASQVGVAHYQHWNTASHRNAGNEDWLVMCGSSGREVYLGSSPDSNIATNHGQNFDKKYKLYVNNGEKSDFAIMEVMVWNRKLSADEMKATVRYLNDKLA